ncbi:Rdx family protein [Halalkalicoccus paucihalophilus]|jgi:selenoprotein W-related protein|uniref:Rdx family protein n=1 Tax=Halalkalicoccus paucihalophilus TaxID=1008153 RepID=A0A151ACK8_9EURY|nr:Rdx family protein [Halalkalicoccus paucihalophilus]KYH25343.1 Rdx family protein [Halalkalicoccus paucihalophilus]
MTTVEIEYCVPCGFLERAEAVQHALLTNFGEEIDELSLITGDHGIFEVRIDGDVIFEKSEDEYDVDQITRDVRARL